jgi:hypothetical protein
MSHDAGEEYAASPISVPRSTLPEALQLFSEEKIPQSLLPLERYPVIMRWDERMVENTVRQEEGYG